MLLWDEVSWGKSVHFLKKCIELMLSYKYALVTHVEMQLHLADFINIVVCDLRFDRMAHHVSARYVARHLFEVCSPSQRELLQSLTDVQLLGMHFRRLARFSSTILPVYADDFSTVTVE